MTVRYPPDRILNRESIDTLWSNGWTITPVRLHPDPYHIPQEIIPRDRCYQWVSLQHDLTKYEGAGWKRVPAERHPGVFAPWGYVGEVSIGDLILLEKPKSEVDDFHKAQRAKVQNNVSDWANKAARMGITGTVAVGGEREAKVTEIGKGEVSHTELPAELMPHLRDILKERDRLVAEEHRAYLAKQLLEKQPGDPIDESFDLLACRVRCMEIAIKNIRAKIAAEQKDF